MSELASSAHLEGDLPSSKLPTRLRTAAGAVQAALQDSLRSQAAAASLHQQLAGELLVRTYRICSHPAASLLVGS